MKRVLAAVALAAGLSGCLGGPWEASTVHKPAVIQEDDPRWDCQTMGNRVCGAVSVETFTEGEDERGPIMWVRVWDERNRLVFGPIRVEKFER